MGASPRAFATVREESHRGGGGPVVLPRPGARPVGSGFCLRGKHSL